SRRHGAARGTGAHDDVIERRVAARLRACQEFRAIGVASRLVQRFLFLVFDFDTPAKHRALPLKPFQESLQLLLFIRSQWLGEPVATIEHEVGTLARLEQSLARFRLENAQARLFGVLAL